MIYIDQSAGMYYAAGCPKSYRKVAAYDVPTQAKNTVANYYKFTNIFIATKGNGIAINYFLFNDQNAMLSIYNSKGIAINDIPIEANPGRHTIIWDGKNRDGRSTAPGCYLVKLVQDGKAACQKFILAN